MKQLISELLDVYEALHAPAMHLQVRGHRCEEVDDKLPPGFGLRGCVCGWRVSYDNLNRARDRLSRVIRRLEGDPP